MSELSSSERLISHPHQSLLTHLEHVDEVSRRALTTKVLAEDFFPDQDAEVLRHLLVYYHDFGKAMALFQYRIIQATERAEPPTELAQSHRQYIEAFKARADYAKIARLANDPEFKSHAVTGAFVSESLLGDTVDPLLRLQVMEVILRHHGNLKNFLMGEPRHTEQYDDLLETQWPLLDLTGLRALLERQGYPLENEPETIRQRCSEFCFIEQYSDLEAAPDGPNAYRPYFQTLFLFSLLLAGDKGDLMLNAQRHTVGKVLALPSDLVGAFKRSVFGGKALTALDQRREAAYQRVATNLLAHPNEAFYSITMPTGLGKTFTAYNAAVLLQDQIRQAYAAQGKSCTPRIIYCLPFTSVIDQNAAILEGILSLAGLDQGHLATHHYLANWPDVIDDGDDPLEFSQREYLVEGWEYSLTVTTFVQFVETLLTNRNRKLRKFHNLANAIVVLDEVQSIPAEYYGVVSKCLQELHHWMGTRFVFVTATQPLLLPRAQVLELTDPSRAYTQEIFERMNRIDLDLSLWREGPTELEAQTEVFAADIAAHPEKSFLFILNLVRESQAVFEALSGAHRQKNVTYLYLSSAILPICRKAIIERIKARKDTKERIVIVSTQVVEAGVDIDLDVVYRAFAPLDSINQSAGRCNRNATGGRGLVKLFANEAAAKKIYKELALRYTERVLNEAITTQDSLVLPEATFYQLNEAYAAIISEGLARGHATSEDLLADMRGLRFEDIGAKFKLINQNFVKYPVFIDDPVRLPPVSHFDQRSQETVTWTSTQVWERYRDILRSDMDRWTKKQQLRLLRPALLQYVVQFPERYLPEAWKPTAEERGLLRAQDPRQEPRCEFDYTTCYSLTTGYFKAEDSPSPTTASF